MKFWSVIEIIAMVGIILGVLSFVNGVDISGLMLVAIYAAIKQQ